MTFVENQGIRIYFEESGTGPPIVFGHSFLCSGEMWAPQVGRLQERFRVVNIDFRGHGRSGPVKRPFTLYDAVSDVVAVLDHLSIDTAVWAGLSIGGMVALRAALTVPDRVSALVIADSDAGAENAFKRFKYRLMALVAKAAGLRPLMPATLPLMFGRTTRRENPALVAEWRERFCAAHVPSLLHGIDALCRRDSVIGRLGEIEVPALVVVGDEDKSLPPPHSRTIADGLPNSKLVVVPGAGHLSALERPEAVTEAMTEFLSSLDG
mgnify:CR=1 FL=1